MAQFEDTDIRRILLEHQLLSTETQTCERWGVSVATLRRWKRERSPWRVNVGPREWLIVALWQATELGVAAAEMIEWLDYHEHAVYSVDEIATWLDGLVGEGIARRQGDRWIYDRSRWDGAAFVF